MNEELGIKEGAFNVNLTLPQAAEALGVSLATARRLVRAGKLRAVKIKSEDRSRWEVPPGAVDEFKQNPVSERPSDVRSERSFMNELGAGGVPTALLEAHLEALKLVGNLQQKFEDSQRRAEQAERALLPLSDQLAQYQRVLGEQAESLAEERAWRQALEAAKVDEPALPAVELKIDTTVTKRGWGQRLKGWLLGSKTG